MQQCFSAFSDIVYTLEEPEVERKLRL
jgi:hypothetical protein